MESYPISFHYVPPIQSHPRFPNTSINTNAVSDLVVIDADEGDFTSEDEGTEDYRRGGYHAVRIGDTFNAGRYVVQSKLDPISRIKKMKTVSDWIDSCSKEQTKTYQQWFNLADSDGDGRVTGNDATKVLALSNLSRSQLKQVWAIADTKRRGFLGLEEFVTAMQLIAVAQAGYDLNSDILKTEIDNENIKPPAMEGLDALVAKTESSTINEISIDLLYASISCLIVPEEIELNKV